METETVDLADLMTAETTVEAKISTNALFYFPRRLVRHVLMYPQLALTAFSYTKVGV